MNLRTKIRREISGISPIDDLERDHIRTTLAWIDAGEPLFRTAKPATPPKHLVSYFVVMDGDWVLLVDHKLAGLWLPSGGHVEPDEHPRRTVTREVMEELSMEAEFVSDTPVFLTVTQTVGATAGHTDVSLWYVIKGEAGAAYDFDRNEFHEVKWFHRSELPEGRSEPNLKRFLQKVVV